MMGLSRPPFGGAHLGWLSHDTAACLYDDLCRAHAASILLPVARSRSAEFKACRPARYRPVDGRYRFELRALHKLSEQRCPPLKTANLQKRSYISFDVIAAALMLGAIATIIFTIIGSFHYLFGRPRRGGWQAPAAHPSRPGLAVCEVPALRPHRVRLDLFGGQHSQAVNGQLVTISPLTTLGKESKCDLNFASRGVPTTATVPTANSRIISAIDSALWSLKNFPIPKKCAWNA